MNDKEKTDYKIKYKLNSRGWGCAMSVAIVIIAMGFIILNVILN